MSRKKTQEQSREESVRRDYAHPTKWQLFWRIQKECWRRMVTPFLMYLFMSLLSLACQVISEKDQTTIEIVLGVVFILGGAAFNGHLAFQYGVMHYDAYLTGCLHRRNELFGIPSGGDHHVEREYSPWKGFYIGFLIGVPVLVLILIWSFAPAVGGTGLAMFAPWAFLPVMWAWGAQKEAGVLDAAKSVPAVWSALMILLPILITGVFYIVGAMVEKNRKARQSEREEEIEKAGKKAKKK